ncbi:integrase/recombinase XerD [Paenibacillus sp. BK033]|uniref:tyrosine-type recombinase/integrase n=1 Tax=Paenibacillus sp. BK033 TaxID=2512133 RepID=UPI0010E49376|nr:tyrosine-type recombinase/integrase [Paenibacillus sp. BK033]TCM89581.1 integrase/recombinase XerD [Paenibacillus sp. BK033]
MDPRKGRSVVKGNRSTARTSLALSLGDAFDLFYNAKKAAGMRGNTLTNDYTDNWRYFREWLDATYPHVNNVDEVTSEHIREYVNYMSTKPKYSGIENRETGATLSPYTVTFRLRTIRTFFNFLSAEGLVNANPIRNIKNPRFDKEDKETFTDDELRRLLSAPDVSTYAGLRDRTLMLLLADTGLRINEALGLSKEHVNFKGRCIELPASMNKNRKPRVVPMSAEASRELMTLINENQRYFDTDFIFLANYGDPLKADHFRKRLKEHAVKAGIDPALAHPHQFRSYFCTTFLLNGGSLFVLQRIVAHANIETTRGYAKMNDTHAHEQHSQFSPLTRLGLSRVNKRR